MNKLFKELSVVYARIINQNQLKCQTVFLAGFDKQNEDNQVLDETEVFINLSTSHYLTETDVDNIDVNSPLERQLQAQMMKESGWRFDKVFSMTLNFYKTGEMNGSSHVKILLRSSVILNIGNDEKYCFLWSILA